MIGHDVQIPAIFLRTDSPVGLDGAVKLPPDIVDSNAQHHQIRLQSRYILLPPGQQVPGSVSADAPVGAADKQLRVVHGEHGIGHVDIAQTQ